MRGRPREGPSSLCSISVDVPCAASMDKEQPPSSAEPEPSPSPEALRQLLIDGLVQALEQDIQSRVESDAPQDEEPPVNPEAIRRLFDGGLTSGEKDIVMHLIGRFPGWKRAYQEESAARERAREERLKANREEAEDDA